VNWVAHCTSLPLTKVSSPRKENKQPSWTPLRMIESLTSPGAHFWFLTNLNKMGTGIRGLTRGLATLFQSDKEPLLAKTRIKDPRWARDEQVHGMWYYVPQCSATVVWQQEGLSSPYKAGVDLLVVLIWLQLWKSYSSSCHDHLKTSSLAPIKSRIEIFWYIWVILENGC